ncbi:MAG: hypothetical protein ACLTSX_09820 [Collinsella sp.]
MLYVFYEVTATDENLSLGCNEVNHITIGKNTYDADMYLSESHLLGSYYHSAYNEDIYSGDSLKMLLTFEVPEGDLEGGKEISLDVNKIRIATSSNSPPTISSTAPQPGSGPEGGPGRLRG